MVFSEGMGGNKLPGPPPMGESSNNPPVTPGAPTKGVFIPANGGRTAEEALLFLVTCKNRPTIESMMSAKLAVISDFKTSAKPFNSGLMLINLSLSAVSLPTVSASISLVMASLVALSC